MKHSACLALIGLLWTTGALADTLAVPEVKEALIELNATYLASHDLAPGWWTSLGASEHNERVRSNQEIYSNFASLAFRFAIPRYDTLTTLNEAGHIGESVRGNWSDESDARLAEAAVLRGMPVYDAFEFAQKLLPAVVNSIGRFFQWDNRDVVRVAATALVLAPDITADGLKAQLERVNAVIDQAEGLKKLPDWFYEKDAGRVSMLVEAALLVNQAPDLVLARLKALDKALLSVQTDAKASGDKDLQDTLDLDSVDKYLLLRASLVAGVGADKVMNALVQVVEATIKSDTAWTSRDYVKVTAAALVSGRPDVTLAAKALHDAWMNRGIASGWDLWTSADYSEMAATGLLGTKGPGQSLIRYW